jgi:hypothetical protein
VYWTASGVTTPGGLVGSGGVYKVPKDGGAPSVALVDKIDYAFGITPDTTFVYWGERAAPINVGQARIRRMPK